MKITENTEMADTATFMIVGDIFDHTDETPPIVTAKLKCMKCGGHTHVFLPVEHKTEYVDYKKKEDGCNVRVVPRYGKCPSCKREFSRRIYGGERKYGGSGGRTRSSKSNNTPMKAISLDWKKDLLMEMVQIDLGETMWTKNGHNAETLRGDYIFNKINMTVKIDKKRFKLDLVEIEDDDYERDGDESEGEGDSGEWVCIKDNSNKKQKTV
jgi:hypothetical protein